MRMQAVGTSQLPGLHYYHGLSRLALLARGQKLTDRHHLLDVLAALHPQAYHVGLVHIRQQQVQVPIKGHQLSCTALGIEIGVLRDSAAVYP